MVRSQPLSLSTKVDRQVCPDGEAMGLQAASIWLHLALSVLSSQCGKNVAGCSTAWMASGDPVWLRWTAFGIYLYLLFCDIFWKM